MINLSKSSILLTGGTGSFGQAFIDSLLSKYPKIKRIVIFSRDELKQDLMSKQILIMHNKWKKKASF